MPEFDFAIIGAGAAGLSTAYVAARLGLRTVLIERARMGGDCLNAGCVPSKALLAAAHAAQSARDAARMGVRLPEPEIDWAAVRAHVRRAIETIEPTDSQERYEKLGATVLRGSARFTGPDSLEVDGRRLTARRIVIAAGSRPAEPPIPGLDTVPHLTNETLFDLPERPEHLLILGGGPIGLEMAQAHAGLGCKVTLFEAARIAAREDPELVAIVRDALAAQGVRFLEQVQVARVEPGPALVLADGRRVEGSHLLVAVGRTPSTGSLDLEAGGVKFSENGIAVDLGLRSVSNRRVFAVGDIADPVGVGPRAFTHVASYHAGIVVRRAIFRLPARIDYAALPRVTYTAPELAQVGLTEADAKAAGRSFTVERWDLKENDRAIAEGGADGGQGGLVKLVVSGGRLIGAGIAAPHAGEIISLCGLAIIQRTKLSVLAGMIAPYPTRTEAVKRAAGASFSARLFSQNTRLVARLLLRLG
jgi:pyruvate/2-oxoglutarate dehydrogenase complex dihydrolipoamide dehydrogenase (E3) component